MHKSPAEKMVRDSGLGIASVGGGNQEIEYSYNSDNQLWKEQTDNYDAGVGSPVTTAADLQYQNINTYDADAPHVRQAMQWIDRFDATEGTMLVEGIDASLLFPHDERRTRYVAFMTDGFIGNESEAQAEVQRCLGPARIFSFGVGQATNRYLLDGLARMGRGAVAYLGLNDDANAVMAQYFQRISHPALTDIVVDWGSAQVHDVHPRQVPDLYVGRPVILSGRYEGSLPSSIALRGKLAGREQRIEVPIRQADAPIAASALSAVWARMKIADLADRAAYEDLPDLPGQIRQLALEHGLMSDYTAFIAVDSLTRTSGDHGVTVAVPVPVPQGVRYDTTVQEAGNVGHTIDRSD